MDDSILISNLNDFVFCPASIYFHNLYADQDTMSYQSTDQINGKKAHEKVDSGEYSSKRSTISGIGVYSEKYGIVGKIDIYDGEKKQLIERKRTIRKIYDGYIFQLYAQYFGMLEMGYEIKEMFLYSMTDNRKYPVPLPCDDPGTLSKFKNLIQEIKTFSMEGFEQLNPEKCARCIYEPACDRGLTC